MGMGMYILDDEGNPIPEPDALKWGRWFESANRRLDRTTVLEGVEVSTVFLGLDHGVGFLDGGAPVLWETMVFGGPLDQEMERYVSADDAREGHVAMVARAEMAGPGMSMAEESVASRNEVEVESLRVLKKKRGDT